MEDTYKIEISITSENDGQKLYSGTLTDIPAKEVETLLTTLIHMSKVAHQED